jgi:hypothetical protein
MTTDEIRMQLAAELNAGGVPADYDGPLWDTASLQDEFEVQGFMAPFCVVRRKSDGVRGTLTFIHEPRVYYGFVEVSR